MSPSLLLEIISLAPEAPHFLVLEAVSYSLLLNLFHEHLFFVAPLPCYCLPGSYPQPTVLLILEWCHPVLLFKLCFICKWHLFFPDVKSILSAHAPISSRCPFLAVICVSPSGHPKSFKKKLIIFPLNQQPLFLFLHSGSRLRAPSSPQSPKLKMQRSFWIQPSSSCLTSKPSLIPASFAGKYFLDWHFLSLLISTAFIQTWPPRSWTVYVIPYLLDCLLQAHPPHCYPSNVFKTQRWPYYSLDGLKPLQDPPFYRLKTRRPIMVSS